MNLKVILHKLSNQNQISIIMWSCFSSISSRSDEYLYLLVERFVGSRIFLCRILCHIFVLSIIKRMPIFKNEFKHVLLPSLPMLSWHCLTENLLTCKNSICDIFIKYQSQATFWSIASLYKNNNSKHIEECCSFLKEK